MAKDSYYFLKSGNWWLSKVSDSSTVWVHVLEHERGEPIDPFSTREITKILNSYDPHTFEVIQSERVQDIPKQFPYSLASDQKDKDPPRKSRPSAASYEEVLETAKEHKKYAQTVYSMGEDAANLYANSHTIGDYAEGSIPREWLEKYNYYLFHGKEKPSEPEPERPFKAEEGSAKSKDWHPVKGGEPLPGWMGSYAEGFTPNGKPIKPSEPEPERSFYPDEGEKYEYPVKKYVPGSGQSKPPEPGNSKAPTVLTPKPPTKEQATPELLEKYRVQAGLSPKDANRINRQVLGSQPMQATQEPTPGKEPDQPTSTSPIVGEYFITSKDGKHWLQAPQGKEGDFSWIERDKVSRDNLPTLFTSQDADKIKGYFGNEVVKVSYAEMKKNPRSKGKQYEQTEGAATPPPKQSEPSPPKAANETKKAAAEVAKKAAQPFIEAAIDKALGGLPLMALYLLSFLLVLGIVVAAFFNTQPFIEFVAKLAPVGSSNFFLFALISLMTGMSFVQIAGVTFWAICQILELMPTLLMSDEKTVLLAINTLLKPTGLAINPDDSKDLVWHKNKFNSRKVVSLQFWTYARIAVYAVELVVCWTTHPLIEGSFMTFIVAFITFQWGKINWSNFFLTVSVLILVEVLVRILLHCIRHIRMIHRANKIQKQLLKNVGAK